MASDVLKLPSIHQARFLAGDKAATRPRKKAESSPSTAPSLPSVLKTRSHERDSKVGPPTVSDQARSVVHSNPIEQANISRRCSHCGSTFHDSGEHFSDQVVKNGQPSRVRKSQRQRRRKRNASKRHVAQRKGTTRTTSTAKSREQGRPSSQVGADQTPERQQQIETGANLTDSKVDKTLSGEVPVSTSDVIRTVITTKKSGKEYATRAHQTSSTLDNPGGIESDTTAERTTVSRSRHRLENNPLGILRKSKSLVTGRNTNDNHNVLQNADSARTQFAKNRSKTMHGVPDFYTMEEESERPTLHRIALASDNLNAYRSVAKIPENFGSKPAEKQISGAPSNNTAENQSHDAAKNSAVVVSMKELAKYRKAVTIYLDSKWKKTRKDRFYQALEDTQIMKWREKKLEALEIQRKIQQSKERQMEQLRYIRNKHETRRVKRLSTQHVKWKYVLGGKEGDREEYGLPSEYYTYYGFAPDHLEGKKKKSIHVQIPLDRTTKSASAAHTRGKKEYVLPSNEEMEELRRRNRERYERMFATRSRTQTDIIQEILKSGLYTVEIEEVEEDATVTDGEPYQKIEDQNLSKPPLQKRTSRLVVKDVVNDAKRALDALDETYSDDCDGDSVEDESIS